MAKAREPLVFGKTKSGIVQGFLGGLNTAFPPHRLDTSEAHSMKNALPHPITLWRKRWGSKRMTTSANANAWTTIVAPVGSLRVQHIGAGSLGDNALVFSSTIWSYEGIS